MQISEVMEVNSKSQRAKHHKKLDHIRIEPAKNGGHTVEHHFESEHGYREPESHVFGKGEHEEMLAHVANALKLPEPKDGEGEEEPEGDEDSAAGAAD